MAKTAHKFSWDAILIAGAGLAGVFLLSKRAQSTAALSPGSMNASTSGTVASSAPAPLPGPTRAIPQKVGLWSSGSFMGPGPIPGARVL